MTAKQKYYIFLMFFQQVNKIIFQIDLNNFSLINNHKKIL
jgi:hypothetical protein